MNKEKEEVHEDNGVLFWVNKSGFPIDDATWERMWDHVVRIHPDGFDLIRKVKDQPNLPQIQIPQAPLSFGPALSMPDRLTKIQEYMNELQYNHTGTQFFEIRKNRPISGLMESAKEMIREALPIKCLEAVILGIFLTNGMLGVERFTLSFKTVFKGHVHRHVVLGISHGGRYGAIGMSRREDLMYKPLEFKTLAELVFDFERCYMKYWHSVRKVKVGLPVIHDQHSYELINWKSLAINMCKSSKKEIAKDLEIHSRKMKSLSKSWTSGPYASLKMLGSTDTMKESHAIDEPCPIRIRRSLSEHSPKMVPKKDSGDDSYQVRI